MSISPGAAASALTALALAGCAALPAGERAVASTREVKVAVADSLRSFARCLAHSLDHSRPDLRHVALPLDDGTYEVRTRHHLTIMMINHVRQAGGEVTISTRVQTASPAPERWYEEVDAGVNECNGSGGGHSH